MKDVHRPNTAYQAALKACVLAVFCLAQLLFPASSAWAASEGVAVHLESYRDFSRAMLAAEILDNELGAEVEHAGFLIAPVDLGPGKGIYFRVFAGPYPSRDRAEAIRRKLASSGRYAMVMNYDPARVTATYPEGSRTQLPETGTPAPSRIPEPPAASVLPQEPAPGPVPLTFMAYLDRTGLAREMTVLDNGRQLFLPLEDLVRMLDLEVYVDEDSGNAIGWIVEQDRTFKLLPEQELVELQGQRFDAPSELFTFHGRAIHVALPALEHWFGLSITPHHGNRELLISPDRLLPIQAALAGTPDYRETWSETSRLSDEHGFIDPMGMHTMLGDDLEFSIGSMHNSMVGDWTPYSGVSLDMEGPVAHAGLVPLIPKEGSDTFAEDPYTLISHKYLLVYMGMDLPFDWCEDELPCPFGRRTLPDSPPR